MLNLLHYGVLCANLTNKKLLCEHNSMLFNYTYMFLCLKVTNIRCSIPKALSQFDRLCGLVVRVAGCRSRGSGSIPCATRFSEK
jgi:hypothetical protein